MRCRFIEFLRDQDGIDAVEYGILVGLIFLAIVGAVTLFATNTTTLFTTIANNM